MIAQPVQSNTFREAEAVQLPDYRFVNYCFETYGLNRGIYNTIDDWFFHYGIKKVVERRKVLLGFLALTHQKDRTDSRFLKFGKGGLTKQLSEYMRSLPSEQTACLNRET